MKAYLAIKYHSNNQNKNLIEQLKDVLNHLNHKSICMASDIEENGKKHFPPKELMKITFETIDSCDFTLIEATEKGVGIGIEAGYSYATGKPVIVIAKRGTVISTTLEGIAKMIIYYQDRNDLVNELEKYERSSSKN